MAAILVIEDDHKLKRLIEKMFPADQLSPAGKSVPQLTPLLKLGAQGRGDPDSVLADIVREVLRAEVDTGNEDHVHESIIGKVERVLIGIMLEEERGNQVRTARRLGINRNTLRKKMKELHISTRVVTH